MGRRPIRSDHPGNGPRTMILRKFAPRWITGERVQAFSRLGLENVDAHALSLSGLNVSTKRRRYHRASATPQGRTVARPRFGLMTEDKAALLKIVGRHFDGHTITNQSLNPVLLHLAGRVGHDLVPGIEVNAIARIRQNLDHKAFELDEFFLGHFSSLRTASCTRRGAGPSYDALASPVWSARSA